MDFATYGAALRTALANISDSARLFVPGLLAATALLLGGWALGVLLRRLTIPDPPIRRLRPWLTRRRSAPTHGRHSRDI
jgi:hypothetical protein